jgi:peroxiredoxin Q/BCP
MLEPGDDAPDFSLPNQDGQTVALSDLDGQYTVVYFYPRADTPGCTIEAEGFRDDWDAYEAAGVSVVGISDDPAEELEAFREKYDLPFDLLSDEEGSVARSYDSFGEYDAGFEAAFRNTFVVDDDGEVVAVYEGVDPEGHADEILSDLDLA